MIRFKVCLFLMLVLMLLLSAATTNNTITFEPFNLSCLNTSNIISAANPIQISVPTYSTISIQVDLRHLKASSDLTGLTLQLKIHNNKNNQNYS